MLKVKSTGFSRSALAIAVMVHAVGGGISRRMIREPGDQKGISLSAWFVG